MYSETLQELGLSPNEARIYEALLELGEASISDLSTRTNIHRRNIYDAINRIVKKGLVTPIVGSKESKFAPVQPGKFLELVQEKKAKLEAILPDMQDLFEKKKGEEGIYILQGVEGFKNFLRDFLQKNEDAYSIGANDLWADPRVKSSLEEFLKESKKTGINLYVLWDPIARQQEKLIAQYKNIHSKFLPEKYKSAAEIWIYADRVVVIPTGGKFEKIEGPITIFMMVSKDLAESYKQWWQYMWDSAKKPKAKK